ncbi:MAG: gliding motility-associated C-terminal domain-containing protein [Flavobacteriales bacterium]|nr:gliding motility-associated C-terminal domain-containing protein [Flavobacteriales bacterium]
MNIFALQNYFLAFGTFLVSGGFLYAQALNVVIADSVPVSCNTVCDGAATASTSGGITPYTYQWVDLSIPDTIAGETDSSITGLCAGDYAVVVIDNSGSVDSATVTITEPSIFFSTITSQTNVSCANGCDGTATVTPVGGTTPYTYLWLNDTLTPLNPLQSDSTATNLCALQYTVQMEDANGCISVSTVTIAKPSPLSISLNSMTAAQCLVCDGTASVTVTGGAPPYTYLWNDTYAQTTFLADSLCISTYEVTASDSNGCATTLDVVVMGPGGFFSSIDTTSNITCAGSCDGQAAVMGSGGSPPYTYAWIDLSIPDTISGATDSSITGLCANSYVATVTDNNACVSTVPIFTITEPPPYLANITDSNSVTCYGDSDGTATVAIVNGVPPYNYVWSSGGSTTGSTDLVNTETGLSAGTYSVTVMDSNSCLAMDSATILTPFPLTAAITDSIDASCGGLCNGGATVTPGGGTPPYNYLWDAGSTPTDSATSGLCAGLHTVILTDNNGCDTAAAVTIIEPQILSALISDSTLVLCNGECNGDATVTALGGVPPYTILWSNGDPVSTADSLCAGNYTVTVEDSINCTALDNVSITEPSPLAINIADSNAVCEPLCDGSAIATPLGGTSPYGYLWVNGDTVAFADSLCSGMYLLTVTDANGCTGIDSAFILADTLPVVANAGPDVEICPDESVTLGGSGGISYNWNPSTELSCTDCANPEATPSSTSIYTLVVKNTACVDSDQVVVTVILCLAGPIPEIITPNGDGTNDIFEIPNIEQFPNNKIAIFNQWGDVVFSTDQYHNVNNYWDGKAQNGKTLSDATYFYVLQLGDGNEPISGYVMIYR